MQNLWLKIKIWTKITIAALIGLYVLFFVIKNGDQTAHFWYWYGREYQGSLLSLVGFAFLIGGMVRNGLIIAALGVLIAGCQNKLYEENKALRAQYQETQAKYAELANQPKGDPQQVAQLQGQIAERDAKINDLQSQLRQPTAGQ